MGQVECNGKIIKTYDKCPICGLPFSDWFVWGAWRHCFPCWSKRFRHNIVVLETGEIIRRQ